VGDARPHGVPLRARHPLERHRVRQLHAGVRAGDLPRPRVHARARPGVQALHGHVP
jgi:hypothetical protein